MVDFPNQSNFMGRKQDVDNYLKQQKENFDNFLDNVKQMNENAQSELYQQDKLRKEIKDKNAEIKKLDESELMARQILKNKFYDLNQEEQKELEELIRTFKDKRLDLEDSIIDFNKQIREIPKDAQITKGIKSSLNTIAQNLGQSIKGATANVKKVLDVNSDDYRKQVLDDIANLSQSVDTRDKAFKKLNDAVEENSIMVSEFSDFGVDFVDDFKKFQKNTRELEKAQSEARRMGVQAEIDIFEGKLIPLTKREVREKQDELKGIEKRIEENERLIKMAAQAGDDATIGKILEQNEKLFKQSQKLADMGIKTRGMFEKSMFRPEFVDKIRARIEDATIFGKTLGERKGELGEFFDGITPGPIQDAFRGVISAVSPVTGMFKELTKPLKIFPFLFIKLSKLFQKQNKNIADNNKLTAKQNKLQQKGNKLQKQANTQTQIGIFSKAVSGVVGFFSKLLTIATPLLLSVTALAGTFFAFRTLMGPLLKKLNIAVQGEEGVSKQDAMANLRKRIMEKRPNMDIVEKRKMGPGRMKGEGLLEKARSVGISEDDPAFKAVESTVALEGAEESLQDAEVIAEKESRDVTNLQSLISKDESKLKALEASLDAEFYSKRVARGQGGGKKSRIQKIKMTDELREKNRLEAEELRKTIAEKKSTLVTEQEQMRKAQEDLSNIQTNVSNLQTSVQTNNNAFQASRESGDGFFMGSLFKPMMEGFGANYSQ